MLHGKRVLITGSNGLLGQKLVYRLLDEGHKNIHACARGENRLLRTGGYEFHSLDIGNAKEVMNAFSSVLPDVVINTAAMTNVDACETEKEACDYANVTGVENQLMALSALRGSHPGYEPHYIHLSTDFVFDGAAGPYSEEDSPNPLSYYALSKWKAEQLISTSGVRWAIARTIIIYGVTDNMSRSNVVLWAKQSLSAGQTIRVVDDQFRSPTLAEDLAEGCLLIAEKGATGIYHLSGPDTMSILELVQKVADFWKLDRRLIQPVQTALLNQPAIRPPRTGFILDKARKELGYSPRTFEEGLQVVDQQLSI
ncbi:MAG: NAD(P)-dependent oxidoreductase [Bacteroidia bacterium]|nr:NAD(P)-dependent oxidoreductase [Bacteroidia bacterium]